MYSSPLEIKNCDVSACITQNCLRKEPYIIQSCLWERALYYRKELLIIGKRSILYEIALYYRKEPYIV